jgi:ABC-type spermidine/putrescine transport system permease subunit I
LHIDFASRLSNRCVQNIRKIKGHFMDDVAVHKKEVPAGAQAMANEISFWLKLACVVVIADFFVGLIDTYLTTSARPANLQNWGFIKARPSPLDATIDSFIMGLIINVPCVVIMYLASTYAPRFKNYVFVLAGLIVAMVLGSLSSLWGLWGLLTTITGGLSFFQPITALADCVAAVVLLIAGTKGLSHMGKPAMKKAFGVSGLR